MGCCGNDAGISNYVAMLVTGLSNAKACKIEVYRFASPQRGLQTIGCSPPCCPPNSASNSMDSAQHLRYSGLDVVVYCVGSDSKESIKLILSSPSVLTETQP